MPDAESKYQLMASNRQLQISDVTVVEDAGLYTCLATNSIGAADLNIQLVVIGEYPLGSADHQLCYLYISMHHLFMITIADTPRLVGPASEKVTFILNEAVELSCNVSGSEPITIEWMKGLKAVRPGTKLDNSIIQVSCCLSHQHIIQPQGSLLGVAPRPEATHSVCAAE